MTKKKKQHPCHMSACRSTTFRPLASAQEAEEALEFSYSLHDQDGDRVMKILDEGEIDHAIESGDLDGDYYRSKGDDPDVTIYMYSTHSARVHGPVLGTWRHFEIDEKFISAPPVTDEDIAAAIKSIIQPEH